MKNNPAVAAEGNRENIIPFASPPKPERAKTQIRHRFNIQEYANPRTGSTSWRVSGIKRDGTRIRENFADVAEAQNRQVELEAEWLARDNPSTIRSTRLSESQIGIAEACFRLVENDADLLTAVNFWLAHGRQQVAPDAPRLDDAFKQFKEWLESSTARGLTKTATRLRVNAFINSTPNMKVSEVTPDTIEKFLSSIATPRTRINYKHGISKFFGWCVDRPRRWVILNPCAAIKIQTGDFHPPQILKMSDCEKLMRAAEQFKDGRLVPYFALTLFGGLRPFEAQRLTWEQINFEDGEIRIEGWQTKTKRPRAFSMDDATKAWMLAYRGKTICPVNLKNDFAAVIETLGFGGAKAHSESNLLPWPKDILRHTAISHFFRKTGSYGQTAERFGNSEAIIKRHYQGRVSSEDTKKFYALRPSKKGARK